MENYEEIIKMFNLEGKKVYFSSKGKVVAEEVEIIDDYVWSEASGMLSNSECEFYIVIKEGKELTEEEYNKFAFKFTDKTERYTEEGQKYLENHSYKYYNNGLDLTGAEVYILYSNYNNNEIDSFNVDIYTIK